MSMSINDDDKLRSLKESWKLVESQMAGTEDKRGHVNIDDQGDDVTETGDEVNSEANPGGDQHTQYSKSVRNGPNFEVKEDKYEENPAALAGMAAGSMLNADDMEDDYADDNGEGMEDPEAAGGDLDLDTDLDTDLGDAEGEDPWTKISRAFGELQAAFSELKGEEADEPAHDDVLGDEPAGDDLELGGGEEEDDLDEVVGRYEVSESAKTRMQRIREARARRNSK